MSKLFIEPVSLTAIEPSKATTFSAGYDVSADIAGRTIKVFAEDNSSWFEQIEDFSFVLPAKCRALVPTGWKMQCETDHCIKLYPRSGTALKRGIRLANGTGIIDADYKDEFMVIIHNNSIEPFEIVQGDRIAQLMVEKLDNTELQQVEVLPEVQSNRNGGFGSTN